MADDETYREILKTTERIQKEIGTTPFWVVVNSTKDSTLNDIVFESDFKGMALQVGGGLREKDIFGIYKNKTVATSKGHALLGLHGKSGCPVGEVWDCKQGRCIKK